MTTNNRTTKKKRTPSLAGVKTMLVSLSITTMLFFWARFALGDSNLLTANAAGGSAGQPVVLALPPVPTLIPVGSSTKSDGDPAPTEPQPQPTLVLRSVSSADQQQQTSASNTNNPLIVLGRNGGGGGGGGSAPVTTTSSS